MGIAGRVLGWFLGLIVFLVLYYILRIVSTALNIPILTTVVTFLYANLWLIIVMGLLFLIADIFAMLEFPFNLPYPIFNAVASVLLLLFLFALFGLLDKILNIKVSSVFDSIASFLYVIVFVVVLVVGYVNLLSHHGRGRHRERRSRRRREEDD